MGSVIGALFGGKKDDSAAKAAAAQEKQNERIEEKERRVAKQESSLKDLLSGGRGKSLLGYSGEDDGKGTTFGG